MRKEIIKKAEEILAYREVYDQYDNPVPLEELVFLPGYGSLADEMEVARELDPERWGDKTNEAIFEEVYSEEEIRQVIDADWYDVGNYLMAPYNQIYTVFGSESGLEDNFRSEEIEEILEEGIYKVDSPLKRFNFEDGFYHA